LKTLSDEYLVKSYLKGNKAHGTLLCERYKKRISNFIYRKIQDSEAAKDLTQETFLRAFRSLGTFKQESTFSTWLFTIAHNVCRDHINKVARERAIFESRTRKSEDGEDCDDYKNTLPDPAPLPSQQLFEGERREIVGKTLAKLPEEQRTAVILNVYEGFTYEEIALITGVPEKTVGTRIYHAKIKLRKLLGPHLKDLMR